MRTHFFALAVVILLTISFNSLLLAQANEKKQQVNPVKKTEQKVEKKSNQPQVTQKQNKPETTTTTKELENTKKPSTLGKEVKAPKPTKMSHPKKYSVKKSETSTEKKQ